MAASRLNSDQLKAVEYDPERPLLVVAGPGSGKTRAIVERVKYLITKCTIKPSEILCLTFSDKAANEMRRRVEKEANTAEVQTVTFHSFCLSILEESVLDTGVSFRSGLISRANQLVWGLKNIDAFGFEHIELGNNAVRVIESIVDGISAFRDELVSPAQLKEYIEKKRKQLSISSPPTPAQQNSKRGRARAGQNDLDQAEYLGRLEDLYKVFERYERYKRRESLIDFDDMIHVVIDTFKLKPHVLKRYQDRYKHVLVDEFQDNNYAQLELVKLLCPGGNVTVVGDDDQSIYRFRGAYYTIFDDFQTHYNPVTVVRLERNYRSTKSIAALANRLLEPVRDRLGKNMYSLNEDGSRPVIARCSTESAEVDYVVKRVKELAGSEIARRDGSATPLCFRDIAILSRRRAEGVKFARGLRANGIPCTIVGESRIFATAIVRDLLAYLRVANDPLDNGIELARIMLAHGISEQDIKVINHAAKAKARELVKRPDGGGRGSRSDSADNNLNYGTDFVYDVIQQVAEGGLEISGQLKNRSVVAEVYKQVHAIVSEQGKKSVAEFVYEIMMAHTDIYRRTLSDDNSTRDRMILHEFMEIVREFDVITKNATIADLLAHIEMMSDFDIELYHDDGEQTDDTVTVTTVHQSKGREFPVVFVVDLAQRRFPVQFQEKPFYCPSELAHGIKDREERTDDQEIFAQEERRLLYVAMTRAEHFLFLTRAEIYGNNTTKTRPSQFLVELDATGDGVNPLVDFEDYELDEAQVQPIISEDRIEQLKRDSQLLATRFVTQMQLRSAIEKITELALLEHVKAGKPFKDFRVEDFLSGFAIDRQTIEAKLRANSNRTSLVDGDSIHFSASALNTYADCPLQYKFKYILEVPSPPRTYFDLGTAVHSTAEVLTRWQIENKEYVPNKEDALRVLESYWVSTNYETVTEEREARQAAKKMLDFFVKWCKERRDLGCMPVEVEKQFELEIAGRKVLGFIDRIDIVGPSNDYEIFDYKTGRSMLKPGEVWDDLQLNLYSLGLQKLRGKLPRSANLLYLRKEDRLSYEVSDASVAKSKEEMAGLINEIMSEKFEPRPDYRTCKNCDYQSICEAKQIDAE